MSSLDLVPRIGEIDHRRLYAREACPSMFAYCTDVLHLSEHEAYLRIAVARAAREHPVLLTMLRDGRLHLTGIAKLAPLLTRENRDDLLRRATHRSKRQIEQLIAELAPQPDAPALMRKLPERSPLGPDRAGAAVMELGPDRVEVELRPDRAPLPASAPVPPAVIQPLAHSRFKVQFTASAELHDKLERLQALMGSRDLASVLEEAVTEKLERLERRRFAKAGTPRKGLSETDTYPSSRHVPAAVRRAVHERDGRRCRYVDKQGRRCRERVRLEYHHRYPFGMGGDHSPGNISLLCHAHNAFLAQHDYGRKTMARYGGRAKRFAPATNPGTA